MRSLRQLETTTGRTTASTSKAMVEALTSELPQVSTQDGGRCSELRINSMSPMRKERLSQFQEDLIKKTET
jgi:hypothetical protein